MSGLCVCVVGGGGRGAVAALFPYRKLIVLCCECVRDCVVSREGSEDDHQRPPSLPIKGIKLNQTCQYNYRQESEECCDLN